MAWDPVAKICLIGGVVLIAVGLLWQFGGLSSLRLGRLPGDLFIERENFRFYFPLTTGILLSVVLTLISWLFRR